MARSRSTLAPRAVRQPTPRIRCDDTNRRGARCGRKVSSSASAQHSTAPGVKRYCKIHARMALNSLLGPRLPQPGARQRYRAQIPPSIDPAVCEGICDDLMGGPGKSDQAGNIYGIEVLGYHPGILCIKVGRTNNMVRRWGEHRRRCPLLQPTLLGYFPSNGETASDLDAGVVNPGRNTTPNSHLLERVVHKELADVAVHAPYLSPNGNLGGLGLGVTQTRGPCPSCGTVHQEIFMLKRVPGMSSRKMWEDIVLPIIQRYARLV